MPHLETFAGRPVIDYDPLYSPVDMTNYVYRVGLSWDRPQRTIVSLLRAFSREEELEQVTALVFGLWQTHSRAEDLLGLPLWLYKMRHKMPRLCAIYLGDITRDELELSWIAQTSWAKALNAYPELETLGICGGSGLGLAGLDLPALESLTIEAHALSPSQLKDIAGARLPALRELTLWLGGEEPSYEDDPGQELEAIEAHIQATTALFYPELGVGKPRWPQLTQLGLCNAAYLDALMAPLVESPLMRQLTSLDLSGGVLTDAGLAVLAASPALEGLESLRLDRTYVRDVGLMERLRSRGVQVSAYELRDASADQPYLSVSVWE